MRRMHGSYGRGVLVQDRDPVPCRHRLYECCVLFRYLSELSILHAETRWDTLRNHHLYGQYPVRANLQ